MKAWNPLVYPNTFKKKLENMKAQGWGDGSVKKVLAMQL